nr:Serine carboxypeptidase-like 17 [Ipomoea batatas]
MGGKANQQNRKLVRILTLPARCLTRARDYYVKGMNRCAVNPPKQRIGRSYSSAFATARCTSNAVDDSEDFRELLRAASGRKEGNAAGAQPPQMRLRKTPRSCSVAMGRIDEEKPCFFEKEDDDDNNNIYVINPHQLHYYPRSKKERNGEDNDGAFGFASFRALLPASTGSCRYIGVGDVQFFYYFIESESNPKSDPVMIWFSGGPGCSSLNGLIYEIGPITFAPVEYNGSLPTLLPNPYSWTKWLTDHQEFKSNPFYVGGDSFGGKLVPVITQVISNGNEKGNNPQINLKGYVIGNPAIFIGEGNYQFQFANGMALISDELYEVQ